MKRLILNIVALLVIVLGGYTLTVPDYVYACSDCPTCTGGCSGCLGDDCEGSSSESCGIIEDSSGNQTICYREGHGSPTPIIN